MDILKVFSPGNYEINSKISIHHPTLHEIAQHGEQDYYSFVRLFCSTPADQKVRIWDALKIYWDEVDEYELFLSTFEAFKQYDTSILFPTLDFQSFKTIIRPETGDLAMSNDDGVIIDRSIHYLMTEYLRKIHAFEKNIDVGSNKFTKDCMIDDDRNDMLAAAKKPYQSALWPMISALTNCSEFKYRYDDVWTLPIGVFMDSLRQVQTLKNYEHLMHGVYSGTVDTSTISKKEFRWIGK